MTYQVRVDLAGTRSPTWRRLEVASDVFLDDLHEIIQIAFGWTDRHLHRFGCGPAYYSDDTEYYLMDFEVDSGEMGIPGQQVRPDEVLADIGDRMFYCYDFGDNWQLLCGWRRWSRRRPLRAMWYAPTATVTGRPRTAAGSGYTS